MRNHFVGKRPNNPELSTKLFRFLIAPLEGVQEASDIQSLCRKNSLNLAVSLMSFAGSAAALITLSTSRPTFTRLSASAFAFASSVQLLRISAQTFPEAGSSRDGSIFREVPLTGFSSWRRSNFKDSGFSGFSSFSGNYGDNGSVDMRCLFIQM